MFTTSHDGVELWFEVAGDGPAVLLIPGRGDSSDVYPERFRALLLARGCRVIRFDPRDAGLSGDGGSTYTVSDMGDDVIAVLDAADVTSAHLVGLSLGGLILVEVASRRPELVGSVGFLAAMSPDPDAGMGDDFFAESGANPLEDMVRAMGPVSEDDRSWVRAELARAAGRAPARPDAGARHQDAALRFGWPTLEQVEEISKRALVIHGDFDRVLPLAHSQTLHRAIAGSRLVVMAGMGHLPRPTEWDTIAEHTARHVLATVD